MRNYVCKVKCEKLKPFYAPIVLCVCVCARERWSESESDGMHDAIAHSTKKVHISQTPAQHGGIRTHTHASSAGVVGDVVVVVVVVTSASVRTDVRSCEREYVALRAFVCVCMRYTTNILGMG